MSGAEHEEPATIDVLLGEGEPAVLAAAQARLADDPLAAIELAETIDVVERLRELATPTSPTFPLRMWQVAMAARRRVRRRRSRRRRREILWFAAAAAAAFLALLLWDPSSRYARARQTGRQAGTSAIADVPAPPQQSPQFAVRFLPEQGDVGAAIEFVARRLAAEHDSQLQHGLAHVGRRQGGDALLDWLQPQNLVAGMRGQFERRADREQRLHALLVRGGAAAMDERVQGLAALIAREVQEALGAPATGAPAPGTPSTGTPSVGSGLPEAAQLDLVGAGYAVRALLASGTAAAGGPHAALLARLCEHLTAALHDGAGSAAERASALFALAEAAASTGGDLEFVRRATEQLALAALPDSGWDHGRRPPLLQVHASPAPLLGDCGRLLVLAPAFGVDPDLACRLRVLLAAHLEERRESEVRRETAGEEPALLAAELYGFADLVDRETIDRRLRTFEMAPLAPDFLAAQQLAWSREVGARGWASFQLELRNLATVPAPKELRDRAALLLCLATDFAAPGLSALALPAAASTARDPSSGAPRGN